MKKEELKSEASRPAAGVGGAFYALFVGLSGWVKSGRGFSLCPIFCPLFLLFALVFPPFLMLYVLWALKKPDASFTPLGELKSKRGSYLGLWLMYMAGAAVIYTAFDYYTAYITQVYAHKAAAEQTLQIATPSQIDYANAFNLALAGAGFAFYILLAFIFLAAVSMALNEGANLKSAGKKLLSVLPSVLILAALMVGVMGLIERAFAHFKMQAIEAIVLNQPYTDLSMLFLALRIYVLSSFAAACALIAAMAYRQFVNQVVNDNAS